MFSYRHAFHAGNHADVLKHITLMATLRHLMLKETGIHLIDTHAGAGLYRLDGDYAEKGGEAQDGIVKLMAAMRPTEGQPAESTPAIDDYLDLVADFNPSGSLRVYPGSPFVMHRLMREASRDRLKLFELHPTDARALDRHVADLRAGRQVAVLREDGFEHLKKFLPPPSRRALVLIDPSYEIKTDYARVQTLMADALKRFPTGTYVVWHPIIARPEAHDLPRRLRTLATRLQRPWLWATLTVKSGKRAQGLPASGLFIVNPPHTLAASLRDALPQMAEWLAQDDTAGWQLETDPKN